MGTGAFIIFQGENSTDSTTAASSLARIEITSTTLITATRNTSSTDTITINATIIDGDTTNLIKSVQSGTITIATAATTGTATITAVTNNNTASAFLGNSTASALNLLRDYCELTLSSTTLTATRGASSGALTVGYCVIEFQGAALNSATQNVNIATAATGASFTATITSVTTNNTMLVYGGQVFPISGAANKSFGRGSLAAATTVQSDYNTAPGTTLGKYACVVVEFVAAILAQNNQRGTITITAGTSNTATITSATATQTCANWLGNTSSDTTDTQNVDEHKITQTNATTLTQTVNSSATGTGSYEVVTFNAAAAGNTVTETVTETDSYTCIATDVTSLTETATETDSLIGKITATFTLSETQTETDSVNLVQTGKGLVTETATETDSSAISASSSVTRSETATESDNLTGTITASDGTTENVTSTDTHAALATANIIITELESANDNYVSSLTPAGGSTDVIIAGPSDGSWDKYLKWLKRKKLKQLRKRALQQGIPQEIADEVVNEAAIEVIEKLPDISPVTVDFTIDEEQVRNAAQKAILAIYEKAWEKEMKQQELRRKEEEEFFIMMM